MTTPVEIDGALVAFDPLILKGDSGATGSQGATGPVGATTNLTMGTISTVPFDQAASASLTGVAPNQRLNLVLPTGPTGSGGGGNYVDITDFGASTLLADNSTAIQAAIDACTAAGGGTVFIPNGTYITGLLTLRANCSLLGESRKGSILQLKAQSGTTLILSDGFSANVNGAGGSAWGGVTPVVPSYFSVRNLTLDGQGTNQPTPPGRADWRDNNALLKLWGYHMALTDLELINACEIALYTEHYGNWEDTFNEFQFAESNFERIYAKNYGAVGWVNRGPHDSVCRSVYLSSYHEGTQNMAQYGYIQQASGGSYSSSGMICDVLHVWGEHSQNSVYIDTSNVVDGWIYAEGCTLSAIKLVNTSGNSFEATVGYCADGVEMYSGSNNNVRASVQSNVTGALFKMRASSGDTLTALPGGNPTGAFFDCTTGAGNYVGGNNIFRSARPFNATMFAGTVNTSDRTETTSDATAAANRVTNFQWPLGSNTVTLSNVAGGVGSLNLGSSELITTAGLRHGKRAVSSSVTAQTSDFHILASTSTTGYTVTLPTAVGIDGKIFAVTKTDSNAFNVLVATTSSQTLSLPGAPTSIILATQGSHIMVQSDGANWAVLAFTENLVVEQSDVNLTSGTAATISDTLAAKIHRVVLTGNCVLTFPSVAAGKSFRLALVQDGTGSRTVTWPATVKWPSATAPTLTTTVNKTDHFSFISYDGTNWLGSTSGLNY